MIVLANTPDERMSLLAYMASKVGVTPAEMVGPMPFDIFAVKHGDKAMGAVMFINRRRHSIELAWAGEDGWLTRGVIRGMFEYAFHRLGCLRIWSYVRHDNDKSRELAERLGFRTVGVAEHEYGPGCDGIIYSMPRDGCRWLQLKETA